MRIVTLLLTIFAFSFAQGGATPWVDIKLENGQLLVPSVVGGIPGYSTIDSGERYNSINGRFVARHQLPVTTTGRREVKGAYQIEQRLIYGGIEVEMFGSRVLMDRLTELNLQDGVQLSLGAPFLDELIFQFDYPNSRMRAFTRDAFDMPKLKNVESKRDVYDGQTIVKVRMNNEVDVWLVVDTGRTGGIWLQRKVARKAGWLESFPQEAFTQSGVNASGVHDSFALPVIDLGPFQVEQARVTVPVKGQDLPMFEREVVTSTHTRTAQRKSKGLLGYDVLKHFIVTMDYRTASVHLALPEEQAAEALGE